MLMAVPVNVLHRMLFILARAQINFSRSGIISHSSKFDARRMASSARIVLTSSVLHDCPFSLLDSENNASRSGSFLGQTLLLVFRRLTFSSSIASSLIQSPARSWREYWLSKVFYTMMSANKLWIIPTMYQKYSKERFF